ncbi:MAG TPA: hypothetical protein VMT00_06770 [Thermoanaerobaculia bacterium]|nr:hypothetical protein [Thermoanaerobaculia bacterium]
MPIRPYLARIWISAALLLLAVSSAKIVTTRRVPPLSLPVTPLERVHFEWSEQWRFLEEARPLVPPGSTYTVRAAGGDSEMSLFMLSLNLFRDHLPIPSSYYRQPLPDRGNSARFVLSFHCLPLDDPIATLVARLERGCVHQRAGVAP